MNYDEAMDILKKNVDQKRVTHSIGVADFCKDIATKINDKQDIQLNVENIRIAGLLHDVGRGIGEPHSIMGYEYLKGLGHEDLGKMILGHFFVKNHLDDKRYFSKTIEQKIISYADMHILPDGSRVSFEKRLEEILSRKPNDDVIINHVMPRLLTVIKEIEELMA